MCRIETSIHRCGHASMPIHEFCPRNPSRLLPNERGACQKGYERTCPLLSSICSGCLQLLDGKSALLDDDDSEHVHDHFGSKRQAQRIGHHSCELDLRRRSDVSEEDDADRRVMLKEQGQNGYMGALVLPAGAKGAQIAWQQ